MGRGTVIGGAATWLATNARLSVSETELAEDANLIGELAREALESLAATFLPAGGLGLLSDLKLEILVRGVPSDGANVGRATTRTWIDASSPRATLELLAPSRHPANARTNVDEPMDRVYFLKTLVHELSMLFLWQITRRKSHGWSFFSGPRWFVDGFEEYLALTRSSPHSQQVTLPKYRHHATARHCLGVGTINPYIDGSLILQYLHERFGSESLLTLLQSGGATFQEAIVEVLGVEEEAALKEWRVALCGSRGGLTSG